MTKCPVCGSQLERVRRPLLLRQMRILEAIERLKRDRDRLPTAPVIATAVGRPLASVKAELHLLEHDEYVHRPNGPKTGWDIMTDQDITLVAVRRSMAA